MDNLDLNAGYDNLDLLANQVVEGFITGLHRSPFHGFSVEFAEHKLYNSGESTRHLDWKLLARTDKLFVKKYEEETNLRCYLVLDVSPSMYFPKPDNKKLEYACKAAAIICNMMKRQRDAFGIISFTDKIELQTEVKSTSSHYFNMLNILNNAMQTTPQKNTTNVINALNEIADKVHRRSLIVLFSDMFDSNAQQDELINALQHLKFNKHEIIIFHIVDGKLELNFDYINRPTKFIDTETNEEIKVLPSEVRSAYLQQLNNFNQSINEVCLQFKIDLVKADIREPLSEILIPYFNKRKKLH